MRCLMWRLLIIGEFFVHFWCVPGPQSPGADDNQIPVPVVVEWGRLFTEAGGSIASYTITHTAIFFSPENPGGGP